MEDFRMLKISFGWKTMGRIQVCECFSKFRCSMSSVLDAELSGHPQGAKQMKILNR